MPKYLVRCTVDTSIIVEADSKDDAILKAPGYAAGDEWDEKHVIWEAELYDYNCEICGKIGGH